MLPELMRLLGVDLNLKFAEIRAQAEDFRATTIRAVAGQVRETSLMVGFAVIGAIAAPGWCFLPRRGVGGAGSVATVRVATTPFECEAVMLAERANGIGMVDIRVRICHPDNDRPEGTIVMSSGRQHRGDQRIALVVSQRQEQGHLALDVRFEANLLLEIHLRRRLEALDRLFLLFAKELLHRVAHRVRFARSLSFGLDPKPSLPAWGIANVFHASSQLSYDKLDMQTLGAGAALSAEHNATARPGARPAPASIAAFSVALPIRYG
jgi:hypothetical protein